MNTAIIQPLAKGQITIPVFMRKTLRIDKNSFLKIEMQKNKLVIEPMRVDWKGKYIRMYSDEDLKTFYKLDKLDKKDREKIEQILRG